MKIKNLLIGACLMGVVVGVLAGSATVSGDIVFNICDGKKIRDNVTLKAIEGEYEFKVDKCSGSRAQISPQDNTFCSAIKDRPISTLDIQVGDNRFNIDSSEISGLCAP